MGSSLTAAHYGIEITGTAPITLGVAVLAAWSALNGSIISGTPNITATSILTLKANSSFESDLQLLQINIVAQHYDLYLPLVVM